MKFSTFFVGIFAFKNWIYQYNSKMKTRARTPIQTQLHQAMIGVTLFFWMACVQAQTTNSVIYVCEENGVLALQNIQAHKNTATRTCHSKTITVRAIFPQAMLRSEVRQPSDPMPTAQTLIVGTQVPSMLQQQRDFGRMRIVQNELNTAQQRLMKLQMEYNNGQPERIGNEKNYQKYLDRVAGLKQNIQFTQSNIEALRRELARIHATQ